MGRRGGRYGSGASGPRSRERNTSQCRLDAESMEGLRWAGEAALAVPREVDVVLAHAQGDCSKPLLERTIGQVLAEAVRRDPEGEALVCRHQGLRLRYGELGAVVDELAVGLLRAGIGKGDRVGIWSPSNAEWFYLQFASAKIGAILVNLNPAYRTSELCWSLEQSGCRMLVSARSFKTSDYEAMVDEVRAQLPALEQVVYLGSPEWHALLASGQGGATEELAQIEAGLDPYDPINIQYTSGTTGAPKGATLTHRNIVNNAYFVGQRTIASASRCPSITASGW